MREISYVVWKEEEYYVSRCLNVEVASFGKSIEEAIKNLKETVELYFEDEEIEFSEIDSLIVGKKKVYA